MRSKQNFPALLLCIDVLVGCAACFCRADERFVDEVAPVLARRCLSCHNDATAKGDVSLQDVASLARDEFIIPGDADASYLMELITPTGGTAAMPKDADPLNESEIAAVRDWILRGGQVPDGFALEAPLVADRNWWSLRPIPAATQELTSAAIDSLIDAKLAEHGLLPLQQADPVTLIRRVHYDLTGLPPKPGQIDAFSAAWAADPNAAWHALVDRLLASTEFGEKWAQHWLDIARYAETHGYDKDQPRMKAWPYRDYVIRSFNEDKPLGEFVREQIAGDVLAEDRGEGIVATGFLAAGPWDQIAHVEVGEDKLDGRIAKHLDRDEIAAAVFNVFQSTTIQCAQCHHHKFDPIRSEDYYRVQAIFAGIDRAPRLYAGRSDAEQLRFKELTKQIARHEKRRERLLNERKTKIDSQLRELAPDLAEFNLDSPLEIPTQHGFHSSIEDVEVHAKWLQIDLGEPQCLDRIELIAAFDRYNDIGEGFGFPSRFKVEVSSEPVWKRDSARLIFDSSHADYVNPGSVPVSLQVSADPIRLIRITATKLAPRKNDFIFAIGEVRAVQQKTMKNVAIGCEVVASDMVPRSARWDPNFAVDGRYYGAEFPPERMIRRAALLRTRDELAGSLPQPSELKQLETELASMREELEAIPAGREVYAVANDFPARGQFRAMQGSVRPIYVLHRGDLTSPGERAFPGAPQLWEAAPSQFVDEPDYDEGMARAALADYITRNDNPLLWRSMANRIWQWTFGKPIVGTPNDFGRMGMRPTHPELLDFLAASLRDDPQQSIKSIVRTLVSTQAYRRASRSIGDSIGDEDRWRSNSGIDVDNRYLWRGNRRRLTAEEFRDTALDVSGSLKIEERGGPSFMDFVIESPQHSPHYEYYKHDPENTASHRRSIYRFIVRSQPQPMLTTLDCADPSISIARREESTTALQALTQWNHPLIEAMSRRFAERISHETDLEKQINLATRLAWGRLPSPGEKSTLLELGASQGLATFCRVVLNSSAMLYLD